jgi:hypothetical protein
MTITREIPAEQIEILGLHQGDSLRVVADTGGTFLVQIETAAEFPLQSVRGSAAAWARQYSGASKPDPGETTDDARISHFRKKYGS